MDEDLFRRFDAEMPPGYRLDVELRSHGFCLTASGPAFREHECVLDLHPGDPRQERTFRRLVATAQMHDRVWRNARGPKPPR